MTKFLKKLIPSKLFQKMQPKYHYFLAWAAAIIYNHPSRELQVIGVTGTKGKSSTVELINSILEEAGYITAVSNTIRFKVANESKPNLFKMSMPGRGFMQKFLRRAVDADCDFAVIEMTSEGAKLFRNKFIELDAFVFTNISPEHIESHGSYEKYLQAKLSIAKELNTSPKTSKYLIINDDSPEARKFADVIDKKGDEITTYTYSLTDAEPYFITDEGVSFSYKGQKITSPLKGKFNIYNILAAATVCDAVGVNDRKIIATGVEKLTEIPGRAQQVNAGQNFTVIVDYAHTTESLRALYQTFDGHIIVAVLGSTGGGRDKWKRPEMGKVAGEFAEHVFLTNEDPYDENPMKIIEEVHAGLQDTPTDVKIVLDRTDAIYQAIKLGKELSNNGQKVAVLLTGKGTDPYIMEAKGKQTPWNEAEVAKAQLEKII